MCGIFGAVAPQPLSLAFVVQQATRVNHRGHEAIGLAAVAENNSFLHFVEQGLAREACHINQPAFRRFSQEFLLTAPRAFIGHTRYSTVGPSDQAHGQPLRMHHPHSGPFFMAHNGQIANHQKLRRKLEQAGQRFITESDSETLAALIAHIPTTSLSLALAEVMQQIEGAYSLLCLNHRCFIAARDRHGIWPLWQGVRRDSSRVFASEEGSLGEVVTAAEILPGTMVTIDLTNPQFSEVQEKSVSPADPHRCWLDVAYLNRPDEGIGSTTVANVRQALGKQLAHDCPVDGDLVCGIPDSGLDAALGFAAASGIPFEWRALVRNRFAPGRSFILPGQTSRQDAIRDKQSITRRIITQRRVVVVDDTIVRSNTARIVTEMIRAAGAAEIHWRIAAPPIRFPCFYGIDMPNVQQLPAHMKTENQICRDIGADSLQYLPHASLLAVLNRYHQGWCMACVTGRYPISLGTNKSD